MNFTAGFWYEQFRILSYRQKLQITLLDYEHCEIHTPRVCSFTFRRVRFTKGWIIGQISPTALKF